MRRQRHLIRRDAGNGPVGYLAALLIIAAIVGVLATAGQAGVGGTVADTIKAALCRVYPGNECPVKPPKAVDPYEPQQDCWTWIRDATVEGTLNVSVRYLTLRGQHRVTVTTRRVQHPDGTISYDVIISPNVELGVATPRATSGQMGAADAEGGSARNRRLDFGAWAAVQGTRGRIFTFDASDNGGDEATTRAQALRFADRLWLHQAQADAAFVVAGVTPGLGMLGLIPGARNLISDGIGWLIEKTAPVTRHLPWIGDNIERAMEAPSRDIDRPDQDFIEGGPTVGFNGSFQIFPQRLGVSFAGRGFINGGVRINHGSDRYHNNYYFKMNGEAEISPTLDLGFAIPGNTRNRPAAFDNWIRGVEETLTRNAGTQVRVPDTVKRALRADWPDVALNIKGKATRMHMLSTDTENNPTQLRTITETQYVFSVAAKASGQRGLREAVLFGQTSFYGRKYNTQSILDLDGPEHAQNLAMARRFLAGTLLDTARNPGLGVAGFFGQSPNAAVFDDYVERNGQTYQQVWDSDVTTVVGAVDAWVAGGYLLYEPETNNLIGAEYYNPDRGWLPWTMCRVGG